jgi:hypothetical protein
VDPIQQEKIMRLEQTIKEMHARDADRDILGEIKGHLLASRASQEAYDVLEHYLPQLFPHTQGALFLRSIAGQKTLERIAEWVD